MPPLTCPLEIMASAFMSAMDRLSARVTSFRPQEEAPSISAR